MPGGEREEDVVMIEWAWLVVLALALVVGGLALAVAGARTLWAWEVARAWRMQQRSEVEMLRRELALERRVRARQVEHYRRQIVQLMGFALVTDSVALNTATPAELNRAEVG